MIKRSLVALAVSLASTFAWGFDPLDFAHNFGKTPQEEKMCQARVYDRAVKSDHDNWMHMHHYCDCIRFTNRAYAVLSIPYAVTQNLQIAIGGCDYVLARVTPDFSMLPEIHLQKGKALKLWKKDGPAATEFILALKGNPRLATAYAELSDLEEGRGNKKDALRIVTDGLRQVPESKSLQRRYTELGGKLPFPASVATPKPETTTGAPPSSQADAPASPQSEAPPPPK